MAKSYKIKQFTLFLFLSGIHLFGVSLFAQSLIIPEPALQQAIANSLGVAERDLTEDLIAKKLIQLRGKQSRDTRSFWPRLCQKFAILGS